jgi:HIV-1 Vpr-binding protein
VDDQRVLLDGFLWDLRGPSLVHRFDKLSNGPGNVGLFHPNGNDVVIDSSVWDLRTFSLRCMTGVDQCVMRFSAWGDVMYAFRPPGLLGEEGEGGRGKRQRDGHTIHILDASDYKAIQVHESERQVLVSQPIRYHIASDTALRQELPIEGHIMAH